MMYRFDKKMYTEGTVYKSEIYNVWPPSEFNHNFLEKCMPHFNIDLISHLI